MPVSIPGYETCKSKEVGAAERGGTVVCINNWSSTSVFDVDTIMRDQVWKQFRNVEGEPFAARPWAAGGHGPGEARQAAACVSDVDDAVVPFQTSPEPLSAWWVVWTDSGWSGLHRWCIQRQG